MAEVSTRNAASGRESRGPRFHVHSVKVLELVREQEVRLEERGAHSLAREAQRARSAEPQRPRQVPVRPPDKDPIKTKFRRINTNFGGLVLGCINADFATKYSLESA